MLRKEARVCCRERKAAGLGGPKNSDHIDGPRANLPNEVDPDEPTRKKKKKKKKGAAAHHQAAAVRFLVVLVGQAVSSNCCLFVGFVAANGRLLPATAYQLDRLY